MFVIHLVVWIPRVQLYLCGFFVWVTFYPALDNGETWGTETQLNGAQVGGLVERKIIAVEMRENYGNYGASLVHLLHFSPI